MRASVVVPTFNERENVGDVLRAVSSVLADASGSFEVLVVDDDSPDGTAGVARRAAASTAVETRVIVRREPPDLSRSIVRGFRAARGDVVVVMDADLQHPPDAVPDLVAGVSPETPLAVGTRYGDGGRIEGWSPGRRAVSLGALALAKLLVPPARTVSDPISGFFAVSADALGSVEVSSDGYKVLVELLAELDPDRVAEVGFAFRSRRRGESSLDRQGYARFLSTVLSCGLGYRLDVLSNRRLRGIERPSPGRSGGSDG